MKRLRHTTCFLILLHLLLAFCTFCAFAHSGKTDTNGGHTDSETGEYHYHHGYPAHKHYDMDGDGDKDCPYDFDDKTGQNSGDSGNQTGHSNPYNQSDDHDFESTPAASGTNGSSGNSKNTTDGFVVEFFRALFGSAESTFWVLAWAIAIIPAMLYSFFFYKPKDGLGHLSKIILMLVCVLLVILSPLSLALYALYRYLFRKAAQHRADKKNNQAKIENKPMITPTTQPQQASSHSSRYHTFCLHLWRQIKRFRDQTDTERHPKTDTYLWTALFFVAIKHIRKQTVADGVFACFPAATREETEHIYTSEDGTPIFRNIRGEYVRFAQILNAFSADPRTDNGLALLWVLVSKWIDPAGELPPTAKDSFISLAQDIAKLAIIMFCTGETQQKSPDGSVKYCLSDTPEPPVKLPV